MAAALVALTDGSAAVVLDTGVRNTPSAPSERLIFSGVPPPYSSPPLERFTPDIPFFSLVTTRSSLLFSDGVLSMFSRLLGKSATLTDQSTNLFWRLFCLWLRESLVRRRQG
jgi:hypothetical protein